MNTLSPICSLVGPNEAKFAYNEDVAAVLEQNAKKHG